jgi:hypothetical protein
VADRRYYEPTDLGAEAEVARRLAGRAPSPRSGARDEITDTDEETT